MVLGSYRRPLKIPGVATLLLAPMRVGPGPSQEATMPCRQRCRSEQPMTAQHWWQPSGQRRENGPVGPVRLRASDLPPQHRHLVT
jgi:hypothetical protein